MSTDRRVILVGGCGFVGRHLSQALAKTGWMVMVADIVAPDFEELHASHRILYKTIDVAGNFEVLLELVAGFRPALVISLVGWGMSGPDMLDKRCHTINVTGTENLLRACHRADVQHFIYTSTYNVIFGGHEIEDGNEQLPYFPLEDHTDEYSKSKSTAEQLVLAANGSRTRSQHVLRTAVIRPAAIYGEGEQRHLPRIVKHIDNGLFLFVIGHAIVDWVHVNNLVQAFEKLSQRLLATRSAQEAPAGQAYFISDGTPVENFEFFAPLVHARGRRFPKYELTTHTAHNFSWLLEDVFWLSKLVGCPLKPLMTRAEVFKVGVTHYFSMDKARRELDYSPLITSQEGAERIAQFYRRNFRHDDYFEIAPVLLGYFPVLLGMALLAVAAFRDLSVPLTNTLLNNYLLAPNEALALWLFGSQQNLQHVFYGAIIVHLIEGSIAFTIASNFCKNTRFAWLVQTALLGFPSLNLLLQRCSKQDYLNL